MVHVRQEKVLCSYPPTMFISNLATSLDLGENSPETCKNLFNAFNCVTCVAERLKGLNVFFVQNTWIPHSKLADVSVVFEVPQVWTLHLSKHLLQWVQPFHPFKDNNITHVQIGTGHWWLVWWPMIGEVNWPTIVYIVNWNSVKDYSIPSTSVLMYVVSRSEPR